jgi:hypothetical protein
MCLPICLTTSCSGSLITLKTGAMRRATFMFRKGDKPDAMVVYLEGEIHAYWDESDHDIVYIARAGERSTEVSGMLPFSRMTEFR